MLTEASTQLTGEQEVIDDIGNADGGARIDPAAVLGAPVMKRGRGRPRKVHKFVENQEDEGQNSSEKKNQMNGL